MSSSIIGYYVSLQAVASKELRGGLRILSQHSSTRVCYKFSTNCIFIERSQSWTTPTAISEGRTPDRWCDPRETPASLVCSRRRDEVHVCTSRPKLRFLLCRDDQGPTRWSVRS